MLYATKFVHSEVKSTALSSVVPPPKKNRQLVRSMTSSVAGRSAEYIRDTAGALSSLHSHSLRSGSFMNPELSGSIRRIEEEYFSGRLSWISPSSPYTEELIATGLVDMSQDRSFRSVVHDLPMSHKVLIMGFRESAPIRKPSKALSQEDVKAMWQNMDPVDMESVERDHYLKTGEVLRTRHVRAEVRQMPAGSRLSQELGMLALESLPDISLSDFGLFLSALYRGSPNRIFHRDVKQDAQFAICKKVLSLTDEEVGSIILPVCLALNKFESTMEIPSRVWSRKVVAVLRRGSFNVDIVPDEFADWNTASRKALVVSDILSSGRLRVSGKLLGYLDDILRENINDANEEVVRRLVNAFAVSGVSIEGIMANISSLAAEGRYTGLKTLMDIASVSPSHKEVLATRMACLLDEHSGEVDKWHISEQLRLLNCLVDKIEGNEQVDRLARRVLSRVPDFDLDQLGVV